MSTVSSLRKWSETTTDVVGSVSFVTTFLRRGGSHDAAALLSRSDEALAAAAHPVARRYLPLDGAA
jgi:hypothetical protein